MTVRSKKPLQKISTRWTKGMLNRRIFRFWKSRCCYCDRMMTLPRIGAKPTPSTASREHIKPTSKGGLSRSENYAVACRGCNVKRGNKSWLEFKSIMRGEWDPANPDDFSGVWND